MNWAQVIPALLGTLTGGLIGGSVSIITTRWTLRHQRELERERQQGSRERDAVLSARRTITKLIELRPKPSEAVELRDHQAILRNHPRPSEGEWPPREEDEQWEKKRDSLLLQLQMAIDEFSDPTAQKRLDDIHTVLHFADFWWQHIGRVESSTRHSVAHHAREVLGRISRGEPVGEPSAMLLHALGEVQEQIHMQEEMWEMQREDRERRQQAELKDLEAKLKGVGWLPPDNDGNCQTV
ncbi:hypothetical protein [Nonomuraea sp. NPDC049607]|uniref:hypothetical protein n=1 Tax=Nonomuraea sp. NPDC049607 TaxID=3154732 RepID=UPI00342D6548